MKTLGERIKALRAHLNMTQSEFCGLCGMLTTSLSRIENDEVTPRSATLKQIIGWINSECNTELNDPTI